jgi:hypothetical protein
MDLCWLLLSVDTCMWVSPYPGRGETGIMIADVALSNSTSQRIIHNSAYSNGMNARQEGSLKQGLDRTFQWSSGYAIYHRRSDMLFHRGIAAQLTCERHEYQS